tara:strand:- start:601 stop:1074 length:474 start_codon:yes stop_codon:yes gene_type:complete
MHLVIKPDQYEVNNIMISDKTKNNIMNNSDFYRIYFSDEYITFNGLSILLEFNNITIEKYFNKIKLHFENNHSNNEVVKYIKNIEKSILNKFNIINDKQIYRIEEQLLNNYIKIFDENIINIGKYNNLKLLLKISGIWSQCHNKEYGLTFRFFIMNN